MNDSLSRNPDAVQQQVNSGAGFHEPHRLHPSPRLNMPSSASQQATTASSSSISPGLQRSDRRSPRNEPGICPTDDDAIVPKGTATEKRKNKQSWDYVVKSGIAGGIAGCAAKTLVGPLDRVKILFQASNPLFRKYTGSWYGVLEAMRDINRKDGMRGLFRGHSATLLRIFPYAGIKFLAYEQIRAVVIKNKSQETHVRRFLSGSLAGCCSVFVTYPLEVIRVRLAFETKSTGRSTLTTIIRQIYSEHPRPAAHSSVLSASAHARPNPSSTAANVAHVLSDATAQLSPQKGLSNFYRGFSATLAGMLPYAGSSFLTHDGVSDLMRHPKIAEYTTLLHSQGSLRDPDKPAQLKYWAELASGGVAGFVSQTVSYPLEVIRRRMQVGGVVGDGRRLKIAETAAQIFRERGWRGFYVGLGIGYVKVIPMAATSFYVYERMKWHLGI
ncbi:mitochondrial carrier [Eremomyces bilateralis CBS 781.70]|uniref:Mitochondrial thiamine pyrophosphate carrier 1 n=1 Tax=Eremomyces bilateralis CBS 781.70 TaxID=1392243 RepID=A0A6G1GGR7_9PEZI|nr:mitochondrial carrier [Eremomyces bilateralis CBS 781.70]KAF1817182.1 mitochondrial carrier [Eremomyces bilateralis CBS 781.70]